LLALSIESYSLNIASFEVQTSSRVSFKAFLLSSILNVGFLCLIIAIASAHPSISLVIAAADVFPVGILINPLSLSFIFSLIQSIVFLGTIVFASLPTQAKPTSNTAHSVIHSAVNSHSVIASALAQRTAHLVHNCNRVAVVFPALIPSNKVFHFKANSLTDKTTFPFQAGVGVIIAAILAQTSQIFAILDSSFTSKNL
tara:strand:- start:1530 stop:2126 length:597 start_codon:yes stop_codon:yes gene_type:complete